MKFLRFFCRLSEAALALLAVLGFFLILCWGRGYKPFAVLSGSMEPAIHVGALVLADQNGKEPEEGDIITFCMDRDYVTHRVVRKEKDGWITKGDANELEDGVPVRSEQLNGIVRMTIPYIGYILYGFQNKTMLICLFSFILLIFSLDGFILSRGTEKGACEREHTSENDQTKHTEKEE